MSLAPGASVGRYRIVSALGAGGMGEVYRGLDTHLKREVALKILPPDLVTDPDRKRRFLVEAQSVAALSNARIATVSDAGDADGVCYVAMELVVGAPLTEQLRSGPLPARPASIGEVLHELDTTRRLLEQGASWGWISYLLDSRTDPFFEPLRGDPRFQAFLTRVKVQWEQFDA